MRAAWDDNGGGRAVPTPFAIGLKPIDEAQWLRPDARLHAYLDEKERLNAVDPNAVWASVPGTDAAQAEAATMVAGWLAAHSPFHDGRGAVRGRPAPDPALPPLMRAALAVPDDLVIMRKMDGAWVLAAAALHFPSAWRLHEKIGRPLHAVHGTVPGYAGGTRNAGLIERMFDHLRPGTIVARGNWSLHCEGALHLPVAKHDMDDLAPGDPLHRRAERQTLRRLPGGDILFTIDVTVERTDALPDGERRAMAPQVRALDAAQRDYKGIDAAEAVAARLAGERLEGGGVERFIARRDDAREGE